MKKLLLLGSLCLFLVGCSGVVQEKEGKNIEGDAAIIAPEQATAVVAADKEQKADLAELRSAFQKLRGTISDLTIDQSSGDYYRGVVVLGNGGAGNVYVYIAQKTEGGFEILHEEDGVLFCSSIKDQKVPAELLADCLK
jgi:hypothetical protein